MCCGLIFSFVDNVESAYSDIKTRWEETTGDIIYEDDIKIGSEYYEEKRLEALEYGTDTGETEISD
jgi:hypothetical protein